MFKSLFLSSFLFLILFGAIYPTKKEEVELFDYCYSFEKVLFRNSLQKRKKVSNNIKLITKDIEKYTALQTKGAFVNKTINRYKAFEKSFILDLLPNKFFCLGGYWIEEIKPGTVEKIIYEKNKNRINNIKDFKKNIESYIRELNSEFDNTKKELHFLFK